MKVVLLAPTPPPAGGIAGWTERMMSQMLPDGWAVEVVDEKLIGNRGVFGEKNKRNLLREIKRCLRIWSDLTRHLKDPDVKAVHSCIPALPFAMLREWVCAVLSKAYKKPFIIHFRCTVSNLMTSKLRTKILRMLCQKSDLIIVLNSASADYLERVTKKPIRLIPNFITVNELREEREIRDSIQKIVYVGGIVRDKGIYDMLEVARAFPKIQFVFIGDGDTSISEYAKAQNITNAVFTGQQNKEYVSRALMEADVFMFLSFFYGEGFSNALVEAMSKGLPCIVSDWAANGDMIEDKGGVVVPVHGVQEAIAAVGELQDKAKRENCSAFNLRKVKEEYSDEAVLREYTDCYASLLQ